ncbi:MAG: Xaa-Pro dipeptidase [Oscillospiraceae bacterium]|nr:Xaa-Pro dipeptidase [Oscillospiraceae bacterium]
MKSELFQCHGHIIADGIDYRAAIARHEREPDIGYIRRTLAELRDSRVVYYRDGGDKYGVSALAKTLAPEYGIDYRTPVCIVHRAGYYGSAYGRAYRDIAEYRELLRENALCGADFVKIATTGMLDFDGDGRVLGDTLPEAEVRELVHIAHGEGFAVMAHINGAVAVKSAVDCGVDSVEHGFWIGRDTVRCLRDANTVWVPTCVTVANNVGNGRYPAPTMRAILDAHDANLRYARDIGALVACGSDAGAFNVTQRDSAREEYEYLQALGIDTRDADETVRKRFVRNAT